MIRHFINSTTKHPEWDHFHFVYSNKNTSPLAVEVAEYMVGLRLASNQPLYSKWQFKRLNGNPHSNIDAQILESLTKECVGTAFTSIPDNQLEGAIALYLWHGIIKKNFHKSLKWIDDPSFSPLDGGGDGLEIHSELAHLGFRIWEIKKKSSSGGVKSTADKACSQLQKRMDSYLARHAVTSTSEKDPAIKALKSNLLELWLTSSPLASVGVSIASFTGNCETIHFSSLATIFSTLITPKRMKSISIEIPNFPDFCKNVSKEVWKGI